MAAVLRPEGVFEVYQVPTSSKAVLMLFNSANTGPGREAAAAAERMGLSAKPEE